MLATAPVTSSGTADSSGFDGEVQAVRQTAIAAQVAGAVVSLDVKAGDAVKAGQILLRLDARAAEQTAAAGAAQVQAALAAQEAASKDFERQKQLFRQSYISQAALDRAEAQYKATQAQAAAQGAAAGAARTQSGFYVVKAPYEGVVSDVAIVLGDMAMPGRRLLTVYDPRSLRVSVAVPQSAAARWTPGRPCRSNCQAPRPGASRRSGCKCCRRWTRPRTRSSYGSTCRRASRASRPACSRAPGCRSPAAPMRGFSFQPGRSCAAPN